MPVVHQKSSPRLVYGEATRGGLDRRPGRGARSGWVQAVAMQAGRRDSYQRLTVLSGGIGGARFLQGLLHGIATGRLPDVAPDAEVTVIANTADDLWVHGLKVCPDLDTVMYTLGDAIDPERGWGRREET